MRRMGGFFSLYNIQLFLSLLQSLFSVSLLANNSLLD
jgi:hypothetical protein